MLTALSLPLVVSVPAPHPSPRAPLTLKTTLQSASQEILDLLKALRSKVVIGFVGGSDLPKITEQLAIHGQTSASPPIPPPAKLTQRDSHG
jgi:hypothetical protein